MNEYLKKLAELFSGRRNRVDPEARAPQGQSRTPDDDFPDWPSLSPDEYNELEASLGDPDAGEIDIDGNDEPQRWIPFVASSALAAAQYDFPNQRLTVQFLKSGRRYVYSGVPPEAWRGLLESPSRGRYYVYQIRDNYPFQGPL